MKSDAIDRFFEDLGRRVPSPVQVLLTGAAAGILQGIKRATMDIDFEIRLRTSAGKSTEDRWQQIHKAIEQTARATGITPQYAENIDTWSMIALPAKRSRLYRKFGGVEVRILDPVLWAIGKLTRYLSTDIQDLRTVLKHAKVDSNAAARTWGKAWGMSPASSSQSTFRRQVEAFFEEYAHEIWGPNAEPEKLKQAFLRSAQKALQQRGRSVTKARRSK